ncbi:MAG: hypothetical protein ACKVP7_09645, partial [Hyphomicrobiaceae bacterium]
LSAEESEQVKAWIARHRALLDQKREIEYRLLGESLSGLAGWIESADAKLIEEHAEEVRNALQQVRRALERAKGGEPKVKKGGGGKGRRRSATQGDED